MPKLDRVDEYIRSKVLIQDTHLPHHRSYPLTSQHQIAISLFFPLYAPIFSRWAAYRCNDPDLYPFFRKRFAVYRPNY